MGRLGAYNKAERNLLYGEISRLKKINKKLADENRRLHGTLDEIENYRDKYKELIESVEKVKKKYEKQAKSFNEIDKMYRKELGKVKNEYM